MWLIIKEGLHSRAAFIALVTMLRKEGSRNHNDMREEIHSFYSRAACIQENTAFMLGIDIIMTYHIL